MVAITFDTLAFSRRLQAAGVPRQQAEAMADAHAEAMKELVAAQDLATKDDLHLALANLRNELLRWIVGFLVAQSALLVAVFSYTK